ncbi:hypothetical protein OROGR_006415 [Orobanche gracilis]
MVNWNQVTKEKKSGGLGVKDMTLMNSALLGKATWSMLHHPQKLWVCALRHKYLANDSFWQVERRNNASPIWKGILRARDQMREGFKFRIGNGSSSVWHDDWSGTGPIAPQLSFVNIADTKLKLSDFLEEGACNLSDLHTILPDHIKQLFDRMEVSGINNVEDGWSWSTNNTGTYKVSAAYQWLRNQQFAADEGDWGWIWKIQASEKIRFFIWRCVNNALPLNKNRVNCNLATSPACSRCLGEMEDLMHCLRDCPFAREIWTKMGALRWPNFLIQDCQVWIKQQVSSRNSVKFVTAVWGIWKWRNNAVLDAVKWNSQEAWRRLCHEHDEIVKFIDPHRMSLVGDTLSLSWCPPMREQIKLNIDGSFMSMNGNRMGFGGVLRNDKGQWIIGLVGHSGGGSPFLAEALALLHGLKIAWSKGYRRIVCETDCVELVRAVTETDSERFIETIKEIKLLLRREWETSISWIPRESNRAADWLAKKGLHLLNSGVKVIDVADSELETILLRDSLFAFSAL